MDWFWVPVFLLIRPNRVFQLAKLLLFKRVVATLDVRLNFRSLDALGLDAVFVAVDSLVSCSPRGIEMIVLSASFKLP